MKNNLIKLQIFVILTIFISMDAFSQKERIDFYISSDSLTYIYLLPNKKFGLESFKTYSPLSYKYNKNILKGRLDGPYFIIDEHGYGDYRISAKKLNLKFIKCSNPIDSIYKSKKNRENNSDSINVKIIFKSYISPKTQNGIGIGSVIKSKDGKIDYNTMFDDFALIKILKKDIPVELNINGYYNLRINQDVDQEIELFINDFKKFSTDNLNEKSFSLDKLIKQKID